MVFAHLSSGLRAQPWLFARGVLELCLDDNEVTYLQQRGLVYLMTASTRVSCSKQVAKTEMMAKRVSAWVVLRKPRKRTGKRLLSEKW